MDPTRRLTCDNGELSSEHWVLLLLALDFRTWKLEEQLSLCGEFVSSLGLLKPGRPSSLSWLQGVSGMTIAFTGVGL